MKKQFYLFTFFFLLLFFPLITKAQTNYEDVVYLKNGSIIHGILIEQIPNQYIKIKTRDENLFVFKYEEIEKITKQPINNSNTRLVNESGKQKGYINITELNFAFNRAYNSSNSFDIQTINGYLFNPNFSLGLGVGLGTSNARNTFVPVFMDVRYYFLQKATTPFAGIEVGCVLNKNNSYKPDLLVAPAIGIRCFISKRINLNFSIGCRYQQSPYDNIIEFNFKTGVTFW